MYTSRKFCFWAILLFKFALKYRETLRRLLAKPEDFLEHIHHLAAATIMEVGNPIIHVIFSSFH